MDSKKLSDGTCSGDTAGKSCGPLVGSPVTPNAMLVTTPAVVSERTDVARQLWSQQRADCAYRHHDCGDIEAGAESAQNGPVEGWVGDVHRLADDRCRRHRCCHAEHEECAGVPASMGSGDEAGGHHRDQAGEHPEPDTGGTVGPRVAAGRGAHLVGEGGGGDDGNDDDDRQESFGKGTFTHQTITRPSSPEGPARSTMLTIRPRWRFSTIATT